MQTLIEAFDAGTRERERPETEWRILQETGNSAHIEAAAEELKAAREKGYFPLVGERGGKYLLSRDFIVGGAANCSYLLYQAGVRLRGGNKDEKVILFCELKKRKSYTEYEQSDHCGYAE